MKSFKYFTKEGDVYVKIPQRTLYYAFAFFLLACAALAFLYGENTKGSKWLMALMGILGVILLLRAGATTTFDVQNRTIVAQSFFFIKPKVFHFDDFDSFLISKQTFLITLNATATLILAPKGKRLNLLLHQTMFVTRPLQTVIDETAQIMEIANAQNSGRQ
ncbi:hypothetical protein SAMN04487898_109130 [Pedobacter sp. ok626]|uniref:hypothetical protein n=1 Tax=Pedobacter sp. ok626 TaxID=1761882 RepID=UPI0008922CE4|nr:hypothetical protein [Pedobacter sp. ok626]SDK55938.1 hypothetical protein SAMN04487898_109130 [Pedobacter sp. ok626]